MQRRAFLKSGAVLAATMPLMRLSPVFAQAGVEVNDVHAQLNRTFVHDIADPENLEGLQQVIAGAARDNRAVSICGARHAMGGQQFGTGTTLIDSGKLNRVIGLDRENGILELEAGIRWPQVMDWLNREAPGLSIRQKQTGADELALGGALSSNIHGRSLVKKPLIDDIESFTLVDASGKRINCSRAENAELFRAAIGGYGLFGVIDTVKLRLGKRQKLRRKAVVLRATELIDAVTSRVTDGYTYGDFQYMTDEKSEGFMRDGIFSCYVPVPDETEMATESHDLDLASWKMLYRLAHLDKQRAWQVYRDHYLATDGGVYWSDRQQTGIYLKDANRDLDAEMGFKTGATLMLSEVYVPRGRFTAFMEEARTKALERKMNVIYGTVRFIEKDDESFMPWARQDYACIIFNLLVEHTDAAIEKAKDDFRALYDIALGMDGSYYLTYHRWARKDQVEKAYPKLRELLALKLQYDPEERFQSDWYRWYKAMLA